MNQTIRGSTEWAESSSLHSPVELVPVTSLGHPPGQLSLSQVRHICIWLEALLGPP
jgi:hypothetical protein